MTPVPMIRGWVFLPVAVGTNAVMNVQCPKQRAVLYTLGSAIPLFGVIPASVYLGYIQTNT